jgi:hypothetical protein
MILRKIIIEFTDDPNDIRNEGVGDYKTLEDGTELVRAYQKEDSLKWNTWAYMCMMHEMVEKELTAVRGIDEPDIDKFDKWFLGQGLKGEPGDHEDSPYKREHRSSEMVERYMCELFGLDWFEYCENYKT